MKVSFKVTNREREIIQDIAQRVFDIDLEHHGVEACDLLTRRMDITACHANGNRLDLERLLDADDFNLCHDVYGISRHICRDTGKLLNHFRPRFSKKAARS